MAALNYDEENRAPNRQALKLQELFRGRFSFEEARELIRAKGDLQEAANFVLNGDPAEVTEYILRRREDLRELRLINAARVQEELINGIPASTRLFACRDCNRYWWRKVPERKEYLRSQNEEAKFEASPCCPPDNGLPWLDNYRPPDVADIVACLRQNSLEVSRCNVCRRKYDPVAREHEWGLADFECDCGNSFRGTGLMNETTRICLRCNAYVYPARIIPPSENLERRPRRAPMRQFLQLHDDQRILKEVYYPSPQHLSTGSTVATCLTQGDLQERYNFPIVLPAIREEQGGSDEDDDDSN